MTRSQKLTRGFGAPLALLMLTAWSMAPWTATPASAALLAKMSEEDEIRAGQEVAAQAEKEYGGVLSYNDPMSVRVRTLGAQFARLSTRKNIPYTYKVLNNDKVLNAFAAPGGPIYVTRKLVTTAANDAELAYVLGHETAHIERKHIVNAVAKQQKVGLGVGILGAILGRGKAGNVIGTATNVAFTLWRSGYSRKDEADADAVGARFMSRLGYDPRAAISMLGKLGGGGGGLDKYLASHPAPEKRQATVQQQITTEKLLDVARQNGGPRLAANINYGTNQTGYGAYPDNTTVPAYYPPATQSYPPYQAPQPTYQPAPSNSNRQELDLGAPLVFVDKGDSKVIMAPVAGLARWAGASLRGNGTTTTVQRGNNSIELRRYSTVDYINGRAVTMSAAANVYNGNLYAPIGTVANGLGGEATYDGANSVVWVTLDSGQRGYLRLA